jgi:fumarate reductase flavoprotein subunit
VQQLHAERGVVIASGGFTRSETLIETFAPEMAAALAWGGEANTGDGLRMAWELGADLRDMGYVTGTFGVAVNHYPDTAVLPGDTLYLRMAMYRGGIIVNLDGRRFADESQSYKTLGTLCLAQRRGIAIQIFDQPIMDQSAPFPSSNDLKGVYEEGIIRCAPTLRALAEIMQIDGVALEASVARYNLMVAQGQDTDFGRLSLGGGFGKPVKIETPPYYALPCGTGLLSTYCGLRVDPEMQVIDVAGRPIHRLFAAGEVIGGFHGKGYMSGSSLGKAAIFGRIAGANAASMPPLG